MDLVILKTNLVIFYLQVSHSDFFRQSKGNDLVDLQFKSSPNLGVIIWSKLYGIGEKVKKNVLEISHKNLFSSPKAPYHT